MDVCLLSRGEARAALQLLSRTLPRRHVLPDPAAKAQVLPEQSVCALGSDHSDGGAGLPPTCGVRREGFPPDHRHVVPCSVPAVGVRQTPAVRRQYAAHRY